ncbi:(2Fe-2S)-binding protein [Rhodovulum sp. YNF3179]|uniref:(2Fe-2S)-binding protein n=1 Tax=Rhodovulum sp. YNF3179 TaxID=3425127 RepID=UPI003D3260CB
MIVCHCMAITDKDIRGAVDWMRAADPATIITPGKVYRALGKRADCGGCLSLFVDTMRACDTVGVPENLRGLRCAPTEGGMHERRSESRRVSE